MKRLILGATAALTALASSAYVQRNVEPAAPAAVQGPVSAAAPISVLLTPIARDGTPVGEARRVYFAPVAQGELEHLPMSASGQ